MHDIQTIYIHAQQRNVHAHTLTIFNDGTLTVIQICWHNNKRQY